MEKLVGILKGEERANKSSVQIYMKKQEGMAMAMSRVTNLTNWNVQNLKDTLDELTTTRAVQMGIATKVSEGEYKSTEVEFPEHILNFKLFYTILVRLCKLLIAK